MSHIQILPLMLRDRVLAGDAQLVPVPPARDTWVSSLCVGSHPTFPADQCTGPLGTRLCARTTSFDLSSDPESPGTVSIANEAVLEMLPSPTPCVPGTAAHTFAPGLLSGPSRDAFSPEAAAHGGGTPTKAPFIPCMM